MIPYFYDITVDCNSVDLLNSSLFFRNCFALRCYVSSCIWQKVIKNATSNTLKNLLVLEIKLISTKIYNFFQRLKDYCVKSCDQWSGKKIFDIDGAGNIFFNWTKNFYFYYQKSCNIWPYWSLISIKQVHRNTWTSLTFKDSGSMGSLITDFSDFCGCFWCQNT